MVLVLSLAYCSWQMTRKLCHVFVERKDHVDMFGHLVCHLLKCLAIDFHANLVHQEALCILNPSSRFACVSIPKLFIVVVSIDHCEGVVREAPTI